MIAQSAGHAWHAVNCSRAAARTGSATYTMGCGRASKGGLFFRLRKSALGLLAAALRIGRGTNGPKRMVQLRRWKKMIPCSTPRFRIVDVNNFGRKVRGEGRRSFFRCGWLLPTLIFNSALRYNAGERSKVVKLSLKFGGQCLVTNQSICKNSHREHRRPTYEHYKNKWN